MENYPDSRPSTKFPSGTSSPTRTVFGRRKFGRSSGFESDKRRELARKLNRNFPFFPVVVVPAPKMLLIAKPFAFRVDRRTNYQGKTMPFGDAAGWLRSGLVELLEKKKAIIMIVPHCLLAGPNARYWDVGSPPSTERGAPAPGETDNASSCS